MDIERTMQFILEHQAQHAVEIQQLREQLRERDAAFSSKLEGLTGSILTVVGVQAKQQDMIGSLITGMNQLVDGQRQTRENQRELREDQRQTRENLNALIKIVDQLVRRNGGQS